MNPIDRCAEKRIDGGRTKRAQRAAPLCRATASVAAVGCGKRGACPTRSRPFSRRLWQIIGGEAKFLAQFSVKISESGSQFGVDSFARLRFLQTLQNMKSVFQTQSTPMCAETAATVFWNKSDPYRELRRARSEHRQSAPVWLRPAEAARLRAKSVHHRECRPREKDPRYVRFLVGSIAVRIVFRSARSRSAGNASIECRKKPSAGGRKNSAMVIQSILRCTFRPMRKGSKWLM